VQTPTFTETVPPSGDVASQAGSRAAELGRKAAASIDEKRGGVARGMDAVASTLREKAEAMPPGEKVARAAHTAAGAMEKAADYVRDQDVRGMLSDARQGVKNHPGATLLTAAALGFLLARMMSRH
jgi:hypothetical protein